MKEKADSPVYEKLTYEEAYQALEEVVRSLEAGGQTLDSALELFDRGQKLVQRCMAMLDSAELRVKQITESGLVEFAESE